MISEIARGIAELAIQLVRKASEEHPDAPSELLRLERMLGRELAATRENRRKKLAQLDALR